MLCHFVSLRSEGVLNNMEDLLQGMPDMGETEPKGEGFGAQVIYTPVTTDLEGKTKQTYKNSP